MATENNVQLVKRLYDAMARGDMVAVLALMSDDVTVVVPGPAGLGAGGTWHGHEGVQQCFRKLRELQRNERLEIEDFVAEADRVVVLLHVAATVLSTGKMFESDIIHFFTVKDGKIVSLRDSLIPPQSSKRLAHDRDQSLSDQFCGRLQRAQSPRGPGEPS